MTTEIDIIVSGPDSTDVRLVVEAKLDIRDLRPVEDQLKRAMVRLACPLGLIITPEKLVAFLDSYRSAGPESVDKLGEFRISHLLEYQPAGREPAEARRFESAVQKWLEDLPQTSNRERVGDPRLWEVLNTYVVPAIETGMVRAAAPRY
jgi:hypothetical protein